MPMQDNASGLMPADRESEVHLVAAAAWLTASQVGVRVFVGLIALTLPQLRVARELESPEAAAEALSCSGCQSQRCPYLQLT